MTLAQPITPLAGKLPFSAWTFEDLFGLPDDGYRYEIFEGTLLVSPVSPVSHGSVVIRLRKLLTKHLPESLEVGENFGVLKYDGLSYFIPDLVVFDADLLGAKIDALQPSTVSLVAEVVSPSNPGNDHVIKRNGYAITGVQEFWIIDPRTQTVHILTQPSAEGYRRERTYSAGEIIKAEEPFPLEIPVSSLFS